MANRSTTVVLETRATQRHRRRRGSDMSNPVSRVRDPRGPALCGSAWQHSESPHQETGPCRSGAHGRGLPNACWCRFRWRVSPNGEVDARRRSRVVSAVMCAPGAPNHAFRNTLRSLQPACLRTAGPSPDDIGKHTRLGPHCRRADAGVSDIAEMRWRPGNRCDGTSDAPRHRSRQLEDPPHALVSEVCRRVEHQRAASVDHLYPVLSSVCGGRG